MNPWWLIVAAILLLPLAFAIGGYNGVSLAGSLFAVVFIVACIRRAGEAS